MKKIALFFLLLSINAIAGTTITDNGTHLIIDDGTSKTIIAKPFKCVIESPQELSIRDVFSGNSMVFINYASVTSPSHTSIADLQSTVMGYSGGSLPSGAATSALQTTGNTSLSSIKTNTRIHSRVTAFTNTTTTGMVGSGTHSISIANIGSATGTVKTVNLPAGVTLNFNTTGNDTLDAIPYVATGTNFLITTVK